jgi:hypothetical protein
MQSIHTATEHRNALGGLQISLASRIDEGDDLLSILLHGARKPLLKCESSPAVMFARQLDEAIPGLVLVCKPMKVFEKAVASVRLRNF